MSAVTAFFIFVQIVLGAITRLTESGLSCPDWPLCYGLWFPTPEKLAVLPEVNYTFGQVMSEWFHRFNAAIAVGPLTLVLLVLAYRLRAVVRGLFPTMVTASVVLLIEAGLGGFTVLDSNSPWSVAVHLTVALILIGLVMRAHLLVRQRPDSATPPAGAMTAVMVAMVLVVITVASGAMMAKSGASLACPSWPLCDGGLIPDLADASVRLAFLHRVFALAAGLAVVTLWFVARRREGERRAPFARAANMALSVLVAQVVVGVVVFKAFDAETLWPQVLAGTVHQAIGVMLFATFVVMGWMLGPARPTADG
ncbi:MAG: COX15/CtaA family protein [Alphaproteobacteria bacterium]